MTKYQLRNAWFYGQTVKFQIRSIDYLRECNVLLKPFTFANVDEYSWRNRIQSKNVSLLITISKQEVSDPISCWLSFDLAQSPILPGQNMCTYASEYNP